MSGNRQTLVQDQSGAMMLFGLFMALFLIGALYYTLGVGDAVLYKRVLQDSADAGAFAASVTAAKGMNLIALINVIKMILAGVLMSAKLVQAVVGATLAVYAIECAACEHMCTQCSYMYQLQASLARVSDVADEVEENVTSTSESLHEVQLAIKENWPLLAEARAHHEITGRDEFDPPVISAFLSPARGPRLDDGSEGLPVEEDDSDVLCERAASAVLGYAPIALQGLNDIDSEVYAMGLAFLSVGAAAAREACSSLEPPFKVVDRRDTGGEVWLGHEEFQYRAFSFGEDHRDGHWQTGERGIRAAQGFDEEGRDFSFDASILGRVGLAQSEFYWNGNDDKEDWMWSLDWTARLRRLRIPQNDVSVGGIRGECASASGLAAGLGGAFCTVVEELTYNAISVH